MENERKFMVYKHTSPDGKSYIGITTKSLEERSGATGSGYMQNEIFWNAIKNFGWKKISHEVLFENLSEDYARVLERAFIFIYKSNNPEFGYNTTNGGEKPGMLGKSHSEKSKQLMSEHQIGLHSGEKHPLFGTHPSTETRNKISNSLKGKMSGENNPMYGVHRYGEDSPRYGKQLSDESRNKISESLKGRHWYNNGDTELQAFECPTGFTQGRLKRK